MQTAPNNRELSALWYANREKAVARCRAALKKHRGHRVRAAGELNITVRTLYRWMSEHPEIGKDFESMYTPTKQEKAQREANRLKTVRTRNGARA